MNYLIQFLIDVNSDIRRTHVSLLEAQKRTNSHSHLNLKKK